jgi:hypothetical protein
LNVDNGTYNGVFYVITEATLAISGGDFNNDPTDYVNTETHTVTQVEERYTVAEKVSA